MLTGVPSLRACVCAAVCAVEIALTYPEAAKSWRIIRTLVRMGMLRGAFEKNEKKDGDAATAIAGESSGGGGGFLTGATAWSRKFAKKWAGAGAKPMPKDSNEKAMYTLLYVFITLILLSALNKFVVAKETDGEYTIILGSMGALCTLLYSAPNSPLAQPRNVFFGHIVAGLVGAVVNAFTIENDDTSGAGVPRWVSQALSPAIAIALLGRMGITHPPAGAVSFIAVSSKLMINLGFRSVLLPLAPMAALSVLLATFLNNTNSKRQYPMVW